MKKYLLFATALAALASCADDNYVGGENTEVQNETAGISFGSSFKAITRADHVGADAADLLNKHFTVGGFKGDDDAYTTTELQTNTVFDNYTVEWAANTAATTESNTSDWEYVGVTAAAPSGIAGNKQSIKYWDYTATQYDFIAYSTGGATAVTGTPGTGEVQVTAIDAENYTTAAYTLTGEADDLKDCYIADMVTVYKDGSGKGGLKYQDEVPLTFRNLASKVRVALYETVPGYSVKDVKFYTDATTTLATGASEIKATLFTTGTADKDNFFTAGTYKVSFPTIGKAKVNESDYNKAHVSFEKSSLQTTKEFGALNLVGRQYKEADATNYIGRTSATASFAGNTSPYYQIALPNEEGTVLELRIDYTLLAIDGSGEEIKIHGATAFVPAIYATWKPNYAYTYIFKISDNTNGWTSTLDTDPAGLYPITFDAVVIDSEENEQSTITTVATPSITTYQKGHVYTDDEYKVGDIYVQVMKDGSIVPLNEASNPVQAWKVTGNDNNIVVSEAAVMDALNIRTNYSSSATTGRNGLTLTKVDTKVDFTAIPGADGNDITITAGEAAKFTPDAAGTYVFTYKGTDHTNTNYYSAQELTSEPSDWGTSGVWFKDPNGQTSVDTYADGTYYKKYTNRNIDWAVKVIKVQ